MINKKLSESIDFLRVAACFLVVTLHSAAPWFYSFGSYWWKVNIIDSITRVSVPIFIMITGSLLINEKNKDYSMVPNRIKKVSILILFWSAVYYLSYNKNQSLLNFTELVIFNEIKFHFWYLYAMIGFYIAIPILSLIYLNSRKTTSYIIVVLWVISSNLDILSYLLPPVYRLGSIYNISFLSNFVGFMLLGKIISELFTNNRTKSLILLLVVYLIASLLTAAITYIASQSNGSPEILFYSYTSPITIIGAVSFFIMAKNVTTLYGDRSKKVIKSVADLTLGIYCIHILVLEKITNKIINHYTYEVGFISITATAIITFLISSLIIFSLKRFKFLSQVV